MRLLVAALAVALLVGCEADDPKPAARTGSTTPSSSPSASDASLTPRARTYAKNRVAAIAELKRVLGLVALPDGAVRLPGEPEGWQGGYTTLGPSDPALTQSEWWVVTESVDEVEAFFMAQQPEGLQSEEGGGGPVDTRDIFYNQTDPPDEDAFLPVSVLVTVGTHDGGTVIRVNTYGAARQVPPPELRITGDVTSVDVVQVLSNPGRKPRKPVRATVTGSDANRLTDAVNELRASIWPPVVASCPFPGNPPPSDTLTFHSSESDVVVILEPACWGQVHVSRDGIEAPLGIPGENGDATLEPGSFNQLVSAVLGTD